MTRRLLFSYLGLAVLILVVLEAPLAVLAQRFERELATSQAQRDASGLVAVVTDRLEEGQGLGLGPVVSDYQAHTGGEVFVVGTTAQIVASSSNDTDNDPDGEWKPFTDRALDGQAVSAFSSDEGRPYAVAAAPVEADGRIVGAVILGTPATLTENRIHEIWAALGVFAVAALVVTAVVGVLLARSFARPVARLEAAVGRVGQGELGARAVEEEGPPEIRSLALRFNRMAERINDLVEAQRRFVADASHQLRSPLTALRLRVDNLVAAKGEEAGELAAFTRELERLSRIVDGLLALSRADQEHDERSEVAVAEVVAERCEAWGALASERDVDLCLTVDPGGSTSLLVAGDLDQILDNLLANALEVSPPGGRIEVQVLTTARGGRAVQVRDEGPGMTEEERSHAFDRFWQGTNGSGRSGLGLAIVRQLAARNDVRVELLEARPHGLNAVVEIPAGHGRG